MSENVENKTVNGTSSPTDSQSKKEREAAIEEAMNHLGKGKRNLLVNDINAASYSLQEACRMLAELYGETANECGDAYYYYGRSLLELARIENGVLGNALDGEDDKATEDDEEEGEGDGTDTEEMEDDSQEGEVPEEEDISNLQLSWEMLELAKVIFKQQEESDKPNMSLKIAQVSLKLGEVGLESENYAQSIEDFKDCLKIQESCMKPDDRCLAETHYQLGIAHSFSDEFDNAINSFKNAVTVIESRISNLQKLKVEKETLSEEQKKKDLEKQSDSSYTEQEEIDELKQLLPEMKDKIIDMEQMKKDAKDKLQKLAKQSAALAATIGGGGSSSNGSSLSEETNAFGSPTSTTDGAKPIKSISHLMRKKRKPEDEVSADDSKKAKGENGEPVTSPTQPKSTEPKAESIEPKPKSIEPKQETKSESTEPKQETKSESTEPKQETKSESQLKTGEKESKSEETNGHSTEDSTVVNGKASPEKMDTSEEAPTAEELKKKVDSGKKEEAKEATA